MSSKPPIVIDLVWTSQLEFAANLAKTTLVVDSNGTAGPSPVEMLAAALAGCMSMDLAYILTRGQHSFTALRSKLVGQRSPDVPHRFTAVTLHFDIAGPVPRDAVLRAVQLSREKYCSVWHSMRQDIDLQVTFELTP